MHKFIKLNVLIALLSLAMACSPAKQKTSKSLKGSSNSKVEDATPVFKFEFEDDLERIQVVSYAHSRDLTDDYDIIKDGKLDFKDFKKVVTLDSSKTMTLRNILADTKVEDMVIASCYIPRHAIHFMGKDEQVLGYIEICFECNQVRTSWASLDVNNQKKFDKLKSFILPCVGVGKR